MKKLFVATTDAVEKIIFQVNDGYFSVAQTGLAGAEEIKLQISLDDVWTDIVPSIVLSATANYIQVSGPATYKIVKPVTASPATVYVRE